MSDASDPGTISRRAALSVASAGIAATLGARLSPPALAQEATPDAAPPITDGLSAAVIEQFRRLPGQQGLKLWAPPDAGRPAWSAEIAPGQRLFIASAFKAFVLAECLRQLEAAIDPASSDPPAAQFAAGLQQYLPLNESVFSLGSTVFNPPRLSGEVSLRTALEAMISHSDDTGTDMVLRHVGAERVQAFVDSLGLRQTQIPTSGRQFIGYIMGLPNWKETTWADLQAGKFPAPRPILNDTITMASSAADLVSFYARALTGDIFTRAATLETFRATLAMADAIPTAIPLGANGFGKGGEVSASGQHALTFAGGMYVADRWVYFALLLNWSDDDGAAAEIEGAYMEAVVQIFRLVQDRLSVA